MNSVLIALHVKMDDVYKFKPSPANEINNTDNSDIRVANTSQNLTHDVTSGDSPKNYIHPVVEKLKPVVNETLHIGSEGNMPGLRSQRLGSTYSYTHEPVLNCREPNTFIIYVYSDPGNVDKRQLIRQTWGDLSRYTPQNAFKLKLFFVMGHKSEGHHAESIPGVNNGMSPELNTNLSSEVNKYGDLLVGDFLDTYENLTLKGLHALWWIKDNCDINSIVFIFKTDDDVFVNLHHILGHATDVIARNNTHFLCRLNRNTAVQRSGRWGVSEEMYPGRVYPTYCSGGGYGITRTALRLLLDSCFNAKLFPMEDFYFTSYCITQRYPGIEISHTRLSHLRCPMTTEDIERILARDQVEGVANLLLAHPLPPQYWAEAYDAIERSL